MQTQSFHNFFVYFRLSVGTRLSSTCPPFQIDFANAVLIYSIIALSWANVRIIQKHI